MLSGPVIRFLSEARFLSTVAGLATVLVLVLASTRHPVLAIVAVLAAAFLVVIGALGAERTGTLLMVGAFATAPMYRGLESWTGGLVSPTDLFLVTGIVLLAPGLLENRLALPTLYIVGLAGVVAFGLVGVLAADAAGVNAFRLAQWLFFLGFLPAYVAWWRPASAVIVALLWAYLLGHAVSTVFALAGVGVEGDRYRGLAHHPNAFGLAGLVSIAMILYLFHQHQNTRIRAVLFGIGLLSLASLSMSGSRTATGVAAVLIMMIPVVERSAPVTFVLAGVGALALFATPLAVSLSDEGSAISRLAGGGSAQLADAERQQTFDAGLRTASESPLIGTGLAGVDPIHNIYLEVAVAAGVFGLLSYLVVLSLLARPLFGFHEHRRLGYLVWAFLGVAVGLPEIWDRTIWVPLALAVIPALESVRKGDPPGDAPRSVSGRGRAVTGQI
ncbi:hypothetical protein GCM10027020_36100 [Nocardioides salsibiostraticola]